MRKKFKQIVCSLVIASVITVGGANVAYAASFGDSKSGASTKESFQIRYDGAAWNYSNSPYKSTSFTYSRNNKTLMTKVAYKGKVTGAVWDDLRWGKKYTTKFSWHRGSKK